MLVIVDVGSLVMFSFFFFSTESIQIINEMIFDGLYCMENVLFGGKKEYKIGLETRQGFAHKMPIFASCRLEIRPEL